MENVTIFTHPLIQHKISILRKKETGTNEFRSLIEEIAMLMGYEAAGSASGGGGGRNPHRDLHDPVLSRQKTGCCPDSQAGLGMVNGILALVPSAKVGHIGLYRER